MSVDVKADGLEEALNGLIGISAGLKPISKAALQDVAEDVVAKARQNAPVKSGRLQGSIDVQATGDDFVVVGATAPYAGFVEYGTRKMLPRPFMAPALAYVADEYSKLVFEELT